LIESVLSAVFDPAILLIIAEGVLLGIIVGVLPGLSATLGVALVMPLSFGMDALAGLMLLLGVYVGAVYGGSVSAILLGIPGTPAAVATVFDGYPMSKRGDAGMAIGISTIPASSVDLPASSSWRWFPTPLQNSAWPLESASTLRWESLRSVRSPNCLLRLS
jgi:TctA family transporter